MSKTIKLEDLSPEQLRAQVRLCFKFMEQCLGILNGEDVKDEAAIRLVDPIGDSSDMELFYKCKELGSAGDLADAMETIAALQKKNEKLQKRLAKKHDELEQLKGHPLYGGFNLKFGFDVSEFKKKIPEIVGFLKETVKNLYGNDIKAAFGDDKETYVKFKAMTEGFLWALPKSIADALADRCIIFKGSINRASFSGDIIKDFNESGWFRDTVAVRKSFIDKLKEDCEKLKRQTEEKEQKYQGGQKVFFVMNNIVRQGKVESSVRQPDGSFRYGVDTLHPFALIPEEKLFASVEDLLENLKQHISDGEGK